MGTKRGARLRGSPLRALVIAAAVAILTGAAAATAFGFQKADPWVFAGLCAMVGAASTLSGALLGFLFGIPRAARDADRESQGYAANTNLEQISDWLTKILIGIGLTQLGTIGAAAGRLVTYLGPSFADGVAGTTFASALLLYAAILGFVLGWLATRIFLAPALSQADREALDQFIVAQVTEEKGDTALANAMRREALALSEGAARRYEELRLGPSDPVRTAEMQATLETARKVAMAAKLTKPEVRAIFLKGTEGDRVRAIGLMQGDRHLADFTIALEALKNSRSAFEQFHALKLIGEMTSSLSPDEIAVLRATLDVQMGPAGHIHAHGRRWRLAQQVIARLDGGGGPPAATDPAEA